MAAQIRTDGLVDAERLKQVLELLREASSRGLTKLQLARKLGGVSSRTVDRAIKLLEDQGARIEKRRTGNPPVIQFVFAKGPVWDEQISAEARMALRLAGLSLAQSGTLAWQEQFEGLENLANARMSNRDRQLFHALKRSIRAQGGVMDPIGTQEVLEPLLRALEGARELEVEYQSMVRETLKMVLVPHGITHDLFTGGAFLVAWDVRNQRPMQLRLGRIQKVKVLARTRVNVHRETLERASAYQIGGWTSDELPFQVKVRIDGSHWVQFLKEAPPTLPDFESTPSKDDEWTEVRFKANHTFGATRWILQFAEAAEVLEPDWLRQEIEARLEKAVKRYRKKGL